jgi:hypothetical protein
MLHKLKIIEIEQQIYLLLSVPGGWFHNSFFNDECFLFIQEHFLPIKFSPSNAINYILVYLY